MTQDLTDLRRILDDLDTILIQTLSARMSYIPDVAMYKKEHKIAQYQPEREAEIIAKKRQLATNIGLNPDLAEDVMKLIIKYAHGIEKEVMK